MQNKNIGDMGSVKSTRITANNKVEYTVSIDYEEALLLRGHITNMHLFSEDSADIGTNIVSRGKGNTKYLRVPRNIAKGIGSRSIVKCLRIDSKGKIIMFYVIDK
ncbi:hypothetical protein KY347_04400 [Candidatus Woesearchaeota archaeon]|nr:hypothetical protein [Candidatus Woesearchaeota archaeon]